MWLKHRIFALFLELQQISCVALDKSRKPKYSNLGPSHWVLSSFKIRCLFICLSIDLGPLFLMSIFFFFKSLACVSQIQHVYGHITQPAKPPAPCMSGRLSTYSFRCLSLVYRAVHVRIHLSKLVASTYELKRPRRTLLPLQAFQRLLML